MVLHRSTEMPGGNTFRTGHNEGDLSRNSKQHGKNSSPISQRKFDDIKEEPKITTETKDVATVPNRISDQEKGNLRTQLTQNGLSESKTTMQTSKKKKRKNKRNRLRKPKETTCALDFDKVNAEGANECEKAKTEVTENLSKSEHPREFSDRHISEIEKTPVQKKQHENESSFRLNSEDGVPYVSPRKQTILRHKKSDINQEFFMDEIKGSLKNLTLNIANQGDRREEELHINRETLHADGKTTLFKHKSSKILVFDEQLNPSNEASQTSGRLLGYGELEIFQLHNGDVTYLSCGTSFVYPLLPKLKILRTNFDSFILPLSNPERYWKILVNTDDGSVMERLQQTFEKVVKYRNLYVKPNGTIKPKSDNSQITQPSSFELDRFIAGLTEEGNIKNVINRKQKTQIQNEGRDIDTFDFSVLSTDIPDSPASRPLSPSIETQEDLSNLSLLDSGKEHNLLPGWSIDKLEKAKGFQKPVASNIMHLNENLNGKSMSIISSEGKYSQKNLTRHSDRLHTSFKNPFKTEDLVAKKKIVKSNSESSMDSLLDEYEENISVTKSFNFPRSSSQQFSISSLVSYSKNNRNAAPTRTEKSNSCQDPYDDYKIPSTSLSAYNRRRSKVNRSRRSSRSDLYTPESNWMDPNALSMQRRACGSVIKGSESIASNLERSDNNSDLRQIYRSVTQRNLSAYIKDRAETASLYSASRSQRNLNFMETRSAYNQPLSNITRKQVRPSSIISGRSEVNGNARTSSAGVTNSLGMSRSYQNLRMNPTNKGNLNPKDIYKIISSKRNPDTRPRLDAMPKVVAPEQRNKTITSRLFGW